MPYRNPISIAIYRSLYTQVYSNEETLATNRLPVFVRSESEAPRVFHHTGSNDALLPVCRYFRPHSVRQFQLSEGTIIFPLNPLRFRRSVLVCTCIKLRTRSYCKYFGHGSIINWVFTADLTRIRKQRFRSNKYQNWTSESPRNRYETHSASPEMHPF